MKNRSVLLLLICVFFAGVPLPALGQWSNGRKANAVLGQSNFTTVSAATTASRANAPRYMALDRTTGKLFVSDSFNDRILRFSSAAAMAIGAPAEAVLGQPTFTSMNSGTSSSLLDTPTGLFVDNEGRLWVADDGNNRILRFDSASSLANGAPANAVLGQPNFTTNSAGTAADKMSRPRGITVDFYHNLWVADQSNHRVLKFEDARNKVNGAAADVVLGQSDFVSSSATTSFNGMNNPNDVDSRTVRTSPMPPVIVISVELWVCDRSNNRILKFSEATTKSNGDNADGVLGQPGFITSAAGLSQSALADPRGLILDRDALWVSDTGNDRVLRFENLSSAPNGAPADFVLGQPDFLTNGSGSTQTRFYDPTGLESDSAGNLWVGDYSNNRILRLSPGTLRLDQRVGRKPGQQIGDNLYNLSSIGQKISKRARGRSKTKVFFTVQNDGPYDDRVQSKATRGNRKVGIRYFERRSGRKNVTARITRKSGYDFELPYRSTVLFEAKVGFEKRARRGIKFLSHSLENGAADLAKAKVAGGK